MWRLVWQAVADRCTFHALSLHRCIFTFHHSYKEKALCTICYLSPSLAETKPYSNPGRAEKASLLYIYIK